VEREGLCGTCCRDCQRSFEESAVLDDSESLLDVLLKLKEAQFGFVRLLGQVGGVISRADLQKPPVRMWLFGLITLIEMRFSDLIQRQLLNDAWQPFVSPARLQKAQEIMDERRRTNESIQLVDCLQLADKGQIIARNADVRALTVFTSRRNAEDAVKKIERLRNNLAHAQAIPAADWPTIIELCEFVMRQ
jgi:hypothetical protein